MKTVGHKIDSFAITGIKPGALSPDDGFETITEDSFKGKWKIIVYYPKDFTFVCPTEIVAYDKLAKDFEERDAILLTGSTDNEFCKLAWRANHEELKKINHWQFADISRGENSLINQLGYFYEEAGCALRVTIIADPDNIIQHVTVNNLNVGRSPEETLRVLDALQTGELCACNRSLGGRNLVILGEDMSWIDSLKDGIPDYAKDIKLNLDAVINRSSLNVEIANGCALASAVISGNRKLIEVISASFVNEDHKNAALGAGIIMAQNNIWYPYVDMSGDDNLKGLPAQLRMNIIGNSGGVDKLSFEAYSLASSIVGKCHFCIQAHYQALKEHGYTVENLRDIGRIASVINALSKLDLI